MTLVHILRGPPMVRMEIETETRWCFACRKHLPHRWALYDDLEPTYFDPIWACLCSKCGKACTEFPR